MIRDPGPPDNLIAAPETHMCNSTTENTPDDEGTTLDDVISSADEDKFNITDGNALPQKVACDRCRRRKIKCDRIHPCTQCIRARSQCSYPAVQKRAKRQRVLISSVYESRIEHISQKIDDLARLMEGMSPGKSPPPPSGNRNQTYQMPEKERKLAKPSASENQAMESSLLSQAVAATTYLEEAVRLSGEESAHETSKALRAAMKTLQAVVSSQKRRRSSPEEEGLPFVVPLPAGMTTRDLPVPPIDKVMACLRMAQDHASSPLSCWSQLKTYGDFTVYLIKVCSPGPVTDAELIIAFMGLYSLFAECAAVAASEVIREDLYEQAQTCQNGLEAVLSNLGFHVPTTFDYVLAMYLATLYCFQRGKVFASSGFISKASLLAQALGLHLPSTAADPPENRNRKTSLFWSVYVMERNVSLCLARPSTIRDRDIMIPRPGPSPITTSIASHGLPDSVNSARLSGLIYDDIYSPKALAQPPAVRLRRVHEIAAEWREVVASNAQHWATLSKHMKGQPCAAMIDFSARAAAVGDHLALTAIYRAAPGHTPASASPECTEAARTTLNGHTECLRMLMVADPRSAMIKMWVNGALLLLPFIPFNIVFCNVVETGNLGDLESLGELVRAMTLLAEKPEYTGCTRQLQVFRALHTVATRYVEVMASRGFAGGVPMERGSIPRVPMSGVYMGSGSSTNYFPGGEFSSAPGVPDTIQSWASLGGMELDPFGTQLGSWFLESTDMMDYLGGPDLP